MRSLPSEGPFQIKALCVSPLLFHLALTLSSSRLPRDRPAPCRTHIRPCSVSLTLASLHYAQRSLSKPACVIVNKKPNSLTLISLLVYTPCALCDVYIYLCLCKDVLLWLKILLCWNNMLNMKTFSIQGGQKPESILFCVFHHRF